MKLGMSLWFLLAGSLFGSTYEQRVTAAVLMGEAWGEGRVGMLAVGEVISQRVRESGWRPLRVVTHGNKHGKHAFSCLNGTTPEALVKKFHREPAYQTALEVAQLVCEAPDRLSAVTRSSNFFTRVGEKPSWARGRKPVVIIRNHAFYRIPATGGSARAW